MNKGNSGDTVVLPQTHGGALKPFLPGQSGNLAGRPVGRRSLSTIIKDLLESPLDFTHLDTTEAAKLAQLYGGKSAWEAIAIVAAIRALQGDIRAADFLARNAYGSRMAIENEPPQAPLTPVMADAINRQLEIQQAGKAALREGAR